LYEVTRCFSIILSHIALGWITLSGFFLRRKTLRVISSIVLPSVQVSARLCSYILSNLEHLKMTLQQSSIPFSRFALVTPRLIIVPTPLAISIPSYVALFANLLADTSFCEMGFGDKFLVVKRTQEEMHNSIVTRDIAQCWEKRGLGTFAVGWRPKEWSNHAMGRSLEGASEKVRIIDGDEMDKVCETLGTTEWLGYAGVRDATTTSLPPCDDSDDPLPPWEEMVEMLYGVAPACWGQGVAREAAEAVMQWAAAERGVRRFIAETEKPNARSGRVLEKMGFKKSGTKYWKNEDEFEWERDAKSLE